MEECAPSVYDQIGHMRKNGITFNIVTEEEAACFLAQNNFFFKLKAFDKNFDKYKSDDNPKCGQYIHLDFAYLIDLSRKDALLRELVLDLALDLEHYLKVAVNRVLMESTIRTDEIIEKFLDFSRTKSLRQIADTPLNEADKMAAIELQGLSAEFIRVFSEGKNTDGLAPIQNKIYDIAYQLNRGNDCGHIEKSVRHLGASFYSRQLVEKYGSIDVMRPWHFMEMASFGDFITFYKFLFFDSPEREQLEFCTACSNDVQNAKKIKRLLFPAKALRNAAAHNDCLLNSLKYRSSKPIKPIYTYLLDICRTQEPIIDKSWRTPVAHDCSALLICYDLIVPSGETKKRAACKMKEASDRLSTNLAYYERQDEVYSALVLLIRLTDSFSSRWLNG